LSSPASAHAAHGHGHNPYLAHHFEDFHQQEESHLFGLWIFLATEVMFFGGLFLAFTAYHILFPDAFGLASKRLDVTWGVINTAVLLFSSWTMAMAVWSAQTSRRKPLIAFLAITIACGFAFMGIKTIEYTDKFKHHHFPGPSFKFELFEHEGKYSEAQLSEKEKTTLLEMAKRDPYIERHAQMFFVMYFCLTGLHGFHVVCGLVVLVWMLIGAIRGQFHAQWNTPIHLTGIYWHLVDLVWIYLFPLIYLVHRH